MSKTKDKKSVKISPMAQLMNKMKINETHTKPIKYKFPKVKNQVFPQNGYNYEADLLELPETSKGYNALLVVDDIYSNYLDFEPLKNKSAEDVLKAFKVIFKRGLVTKPKASIRTDSGSEFKSVVDKYMHDNNILHLWSLPDRHKQMANVENLNRQIGRFLMTYLTNKTEELDEDYHDWTDIVDELRLGLNDIKKHPKDVDMNTFTPKDINLDKPPKFKVGELVYRRLEKPVDKFGNKYHNSTFRAGDNRYELVPRKIVKVLVYSSPNPWRYILNGYKNVSYAEAELMKAKETETEEKFVIKKIIDKRKVKSKIEYLVHWKKYKKDESTWEPEKTLLEDGAHEYITQFEEELKEKKKK
jgi:hypothetical protein